MRIRSLAILCVAPFTLAACDDALSGESTAIAAVVAESAPHNDFESESSATTEVEQGSLVSAALPSLAELASTPEPLSFGAVGMRVEATDEGAIVVRDLVHGYPAATAGLEPGDVVLAVDGLETEGMSVDDFIRLVRGEPGASVELVVADDSSTRSVVVAREAYTIQQSVCDVRRSLARETEFGGIGIRLARCDGGVIRSVEAGGPAELAGLAAGDRILSVDGHDAAGADMWALVNAIRGVAGTPVTLDVEGADGLVRSMTVVRVAFVVPEATGCGQ